VAGRAFVAIPAAAAAIQPWLTAFVRSAAFTSTSLAPACNASLRSFGLSVKTGRYVKSDFLAPLVQAQSSQRKAAAAAGRRPETGHSTRGASKAPANQGLGKWRRGELNRLQKRQPCS
jgi:hypothetical protein